MRRSLFRLIIELGASRQGAVAPTLALSLFGLIAAGGLAFDYARLAAMDTELQQAADQAALAAATQLDRSTGAQDRASTAIQAADNSDRLARNLTRFANDSVGGSVEITNITFCSAFDDSVADNSVACEETADDTNSRFVMVTTELRTANFALTPVVAAFSGSITASAVAGVESSICNVAPLMVCAPEDNPDWPTSADIGRGIRLKPGSQAGHWVPGNFGLLDFGNGNPAVYNALKGFGLDGCMTQDETATEPGQKEVTDAINTRLDVYDKGNPGECEVATGAGCPAKSARKDVVIDITPKNNGPTLVTPNSTQPTQAQIDAAATAAGLSCPANPASVNPKPVFTSPATPVKGLERDSCHYTPDGCPTVLNAEGITESGGNIGTKNWDRNGYFLSNYGWDSATWPTQTGLPANATRYQVYQWELANPGTGLTQKQFNTVSLTQVDAAGNHTWAIKSQCSYPQPKYGSTAYPDQKDRRILTIIAADCSDLTGKGEAFEDFMILRAFDIFLNEPSMTRTTYPGFTDNKEIYGEIIGPPETFGGGGGFQYYSRTKPYLVR